MKLLVSFLFLLNVNAAEAAVKLQAAGKLKINILDVGFHSTVCVVDWDKDNKKDLLVGAEDGYVYFYKNIKEDEEPSFGPAEKLICATGEKVYIMSGNSVPRVVDLNYDNKLDLIVGGKDGYIYFYKNIAPTKEDKPILSTPTLILTIDNNYVNVGNCASPYLFDLDEDNKYDLIIGNEHGQVYFLKGTENMRFLPPVPCRILATKQQIDVGQAAQVCVIDYDADGLKDLIIGNERGYIYYFKHIGTTANGQYATATLYALPATITMNQQPIRIDSGYVSVFCYDFDNDGGIDLLLGDRYGYIELYKSIPATRPPVFITKSKLTGPEYDLDIGAQAAINIIDWNNDTKLDLLVGDRFGNVYLLLNVGMSMPLFSSIEKLKLKEGIDIDVGYNATPCVYDLDQDGKKDLIIGNEYGDVYFFKNIGEDNNPIFTSGEALVYDGNKKINVPYDAAVSIIDYDNDGIMDLLVGSRYGLIYLFRGTGIKKFSAPVILQAANTNINVGYNAAPIMFDINQDRKKDLLIGTEDGYIYVYLNTNTDENPVFSHHYRLQSIDNISINVGKYAKPNVLHPSFRYLDWNNDNIFDFLIGDEEGTINIYYGVNVNNPPVVHVVSPQGTQSGNVAISYILKDEDSDTCFIEVFYSDDAGENYYSATIKPQESLYNLATTPDGRLYSFIWSSLDDIGKTKKNIIIKIIPYDNYVRGKSDITEKFTVDNLYLPIFIKLQDKYGDIDVGENATPVFIDWDNDLRPDLLVGNASGEVFFYKNVGSDRQPQFITYSKLQAKASAVSDLSVLKDAAPWVVDWNNDGKKDLIIGNGYGNIFYYENIGRDEAPLLEYKEKLKANGKEITLPACAVISVLDWNNDGKKDLLAADGYGYIWLFKNKGTDEKVVLGEAEKILADGEAIQVPGPARPICFDWNNNKKKDLLVSDADGFVNIYINYHTDEEPKFYKAGRLKLAGKEVDFGNLAKSYITDWNKDAFPDMIIGIKEGNIILLDILPEIVNTAPEIISIALSEPLRIQRENIKIKYTIKDIDGDSCYIKVEYSTDTKSWFEAVGSPTKNLLASPKGEELVFIWHSHLDLPYTNTTVFFRITPYDNYAMGSPSTILSFFLRNFNRTPQINNIEIKEIKSVYIKYDLSDADDDICEITVEYKGGTAAEYKKATIAPYPGDNINIINPGIITDIKSGKDKRIIWLAEVDEPATAATNYTIKLTAKDPLAYGAAITSATFSLNNTHKSGILIKKDNIGSLGAPTKLAELELTEAPKNDLVITIEKINNNQQNIPALTSPLKDNFAYHIKSSLLANLNQQAKIKFKLVIKYKDTVDTAIEKLLRIYKLIDNRWELATAAELQVLNEHEDSITIYQEEKEAIYKIGVYSESTTNNFVVFPNPFKPNDGKAHTGTWQEGIKFSGLTFGTKIKIYNLALELVWEDVATSGELRWFAEDKDKKKVGSGIYIYIIEPPNEKPFYGKLAIIR